MFGSDHPKATFVYLAYGPQIFKAENYFSILCLLASAAAGEVLKIAVYTDDAPYFRDLPVDVRIVGEVMRSEAENSYRNKLKSLVNLDALGRQPEAVVFFDGDTYMRRSPQGLVGKIGAGAAVLHLPETQLDRSPDDNKKALQRAVAVAGITRPDGAPVGRGSWMWNSGVTGLHSSHHALLQEAIKIGDHIHRYDRNLRGVEQFSLTQALEGSVRIRSAREDVFHYWSRPVRYPFSLRLPEIIDGLRALSLEERSLVAAGMRPGYRGLAKVRMNIRDVAWRCGIPLKGVRVST